MARLLVLVAAVPFLFACTDSSVAGKEPAPGSGGDDVASVERLFDRQCALCHGATGGGDGPAAFLLFPPARDFTAGRFKLASTRNGVPTGDDLDRVLWRGMPGSAMPSFTWMSAADRRALADHVRQLAFEGLAAEIGAEQARARVTPGEPLEPIPLLADSPDVLARGEELYAERCAACHGKSGEGRGEVVLRDFDDVLNHARDLTTGFLKGGARPEDLALRTRVGMHGTAMPARDLSVEDVGALVAFLRTLLPPDANERGVRSRRRIEVARTNVPVPRDPEDPRWDDVEPVVLRLAPLWWSPDAVLEAEVRGVHDGAEIALLVRWPDPTPDALPAVSSDAPSERRPAYTDAVALELSNSEAPPFFGMGPGAERADLWTWRAHELELRDLEAELRAWPHRLGEWVLPPTLRFAYGATEVKSETGAVAAAGMRRVAEAPPLATPLAAQARWILGAWAVVFTRPLQPTGGGEIVLTPGSDVSATLAVWNGANRDLRGRKSIAVWHVLSLAP